MISRSASEGICKMRSEYSGSCRDRGMPNFGSRLLVLFWGLRAWSCVFRCEGEAGIGNFDVFSWIKFDDSFFA